MHIVTRSLALVLVWLAALGQPLRAVTAEALLDTLLKNGVVSREEADALVKQASAPAPVAVAGRSTTRLTLGGRVQVQAVALSSEHETGTDPADRMHLLVRRVYLTARAELGPAWEAGFIYDIVNDCFDQASVRHKGEEFDLEAGLRLVALGREQNTSSGALKAIERSAATRYFADDAGGAHLGAASYRVGVFADSKGQGWLWNAAVTDPEPAAGLAATRSTGSSSNNQPALWAGAGHRGENARGRHHVGLSAGWIPDQGGAPVGGAGGGDDVVVAAAHFDLTRGPFSLLAELLAAQDEGAAVDGSDAWCLGGYVQPAWTFSPLFEGVVRIGYLDTDGRGATLRDLVPGCSSTLAVARVVDFYAGGTWYLKGNDLKFQAGVVAARGRDNPIGGAARAETTGVRAQVQASF